MRIKPIVAIAMAGVLAASLSGCLGRERICREGERPVLATGLVDEFKAGALTGGEGSTCTENGKIPEGYEDYPPGQAPTEVYVDEQYPNP